MSAEEITGAEIVVRCLAEEGVEHVFGYPGGAVLYIYDAIFNQNKFQHILVRHEQAAVHAADAYSRSSKKIGVAIVTSGPGVTNAVTGLATAYMDSIPMVVISGQVPSHAIGQDAFQECDTVGITRPCVKHNFLVKDVKDLAATIRKAFFIATTGRPGPVLVDIPKDISMHKCVFEYPRELEMRSYKPVDKGHSGQIRKAVQLLQQAERPMIYAGGGVILANAAPELNKLVDKCIQLALVAGKFDGVGFLGHIDDAATENIRGALHFFPFLTNCPHFNQHQFTLDVRTFGQINYLDHLDQAIQVFGDLFDYVIRAARDNGHPRQSCIFGRCHRQGLDIVTTCGKQADHAR